MQVFLVGGAVRDELLNQNIEERDWLVVGATAEQLLHQGFTPVGKDFPVFLHPETKEEYALARTERKTGVGYRGFEFHSSPDVTLEEDLLRRDLTINAMAKNDTGEIIDPYGGQTDLAEKRLRHVSNAFSEDPLRVLRVARFAAKFHALGFHIDNSTLQLMQEITARNEITTIAAERIWLETYKALLTDSPNIYFSVLYQIGAIHQTFPELNVLINKKENRKLGFSSLAALESHNNSVCIKFSGFIGGLAFHEEKNVAQIVEAISTRLPLTSQCKELLQLTITLQHQCHHALELDEFELYELLTKIDARRKPQRFKEFLIIIDAIHCSFYDENFANKNKWLICANEAIQNIGVDKLITDNNEETGKNIKNLQITTLKNLLQQRDSI